MTYTPTALVRLSRLDCGCGLRYTQVRLGCLQVRKLQCGFDGGCGQHRYPHVRPRVGMPCKWAWLCTPVRRLGQE